MDSGTKRLGGPRLCLGGRSPSFVKVEFTCEYSLPKGVVFFDTKKCFNSKKVELRNDWGAPGSAWGGVARSLRQGMSSYDIQSTF
jgi:hypothetical protein